MSRTLGWIGSIVLFMSLLACGTQGILAPLKQDSFPGGESSYAWGWSQKPEDFVNVERAQSGISLFNGRKHWGEIPVTSHASMNVGALQAYYPMHVRWKLKDGREFILGNIDVRAIMDEYFKTHALKLQWQREGRPRAKVGDPDPILAHEIKDDFVRIKWVLRNNLTPVDQRLRAGGAATVWNIVYEEHLVAVIKGTPTSGINFDNRYESQK